MRVKNNKAKPRIRESEAESIVASKNIKIFMKLEDPTETFNLFEEWTKEQIFAPNFIDKNHD